MNFTYYEPVAVAGVTQRRPPTVRTLLRHAVVWSLLLVAPYATAQVCEDDGGTQECVKRVQLEARYKYVSGPSCQTMSLMPPPPKQYISSYVFKSEGEANDYFRNSVICNNSSAFCDLPSIAELLDWSGGPTEPGFLPSQECRGPNALGVLWTMTTTVAPGICGSKVETWRDSCVQRPMVCPPSYQEAYISQNPSILGCVALKTDCNPCGKGEQTKIGNPIVVPRRDKVQTELDAALPAEFGLDVSRVYNSSNFSAPIYTPSSQRMTQLGGSWRFSFDHRLSVITSPVTGTTVARLVRSDGRIHRYFLGASGFTTRADEEGSFEAIVNGSGTTTGYHYRTGDNRDEYYSLSGRLTRLVQGGLETILFYDGNDRLERIESPTGRAIQFSYDATVQGVVRHNVTGITLPDGQTITYAYGEFGDISDVLLPGNVSRHYVYASERGPRKLTSIIDEKAVDYAQFTYDSSSDEATSTQHAGGVDRYDVSRSGNTLTIQAPLGEVTTNQYQTVAGRLRLVQTQQSCTGCTTQTSTRTYDANGLPNIVTDFRGTTTDYDYGARAVETQRIEAANATGTSSAKRTIQTDWHASFRKPVERRVRNAANTLEAKTQWTYNTRGQVTARCEIDPNDTLAMAYACSPTTAPTALAKVRRWTYTYCEAADVALPNSNCPILGLIKTINGPRSSNDVGMSGLDDLTTYAYYPSTDETGCGTVGGVCHRKGDLASVTNALGQASDVLAYDKNGRVVRQRDVNSTITDLTYNARGALTQRAVRALASGATSSDDATTILTYDNVGQITRVTQPDAVYLDYVYDNAHRLTDIVDSLGNRIHFTLDNAGNRTKEETFDSSYNPSTPGQGLKRSLARQYNALGRLVRELNAANAATRDSTPYDTSPLADGFDANGNSVQFKDGLNVQTQQSFDPLNRLVTSIQDYTGVDPETANATTDYTYDARNNLRTVKDPDTLTTTYTYGGLSDLTALDSPDTGHTGYAYDLAGNRTSQIDNRGVTSSYAYDALNRLRAIGYPTTSLNVTFAYDESNATTGCATSYPIGRLTRMTDSSGSTTYCYDRRGNVIAKTQVTTGNTLALVYTYTKADRVATITYPSGGIATHSYDAVGHTKSLTWKANAGATPTTVVTNITYYPFGPLNKLTFGNGRSLTKTYDNDYVIDTIASSVSDGLKLDFGRDVMGNLTSASSTPGASPPERQYVYDNLYRLSGVNDSTGAMLEDYDYNKTGDRTLKQFAGQAAQIYAYLSGTHRLGSVAGVNRSYDPNGNTTDRGDGVMLGYDQRNRLASAAVPANATTYDYSGRGERTLKVRANGGNSITNRYVYNETGQMLADREIEQIGARGGALTEYLFVDAVPVAVSRASGLSFVEADHLGTPRLSASPATNTKEWGWDLLGKAFGESSSATVATGKDVSLRYPGQWRDDETGFNYNYFREYEPSIGRYLTSDPLGLSAGVSTYGYALQNPLVLFDPDGLKAWYCYRPLCPKGTNCTTGARGPILVNHQYLCTTHLDGTVECGGQSTNGSMLSSDGRPTRPDEDSYSPKSCDQIDDDKDRCMESCLLTNFGKPRPHYGIGPQGTDCQEWAADLKWGCEAHCLHPSNGKQFQDR